MLLLLQVQKFYEVECATSPCAKDKMRKRLGPTIYQENRELELELLVGSLYHLGTQLVSRLPYTNGGHCLNMLFRGKAGFFI